MPSLHPPRREPSGRRQRTPQRIADAQKAAEESEMRVVLAQPHRRGNRSQLAESPLGRFVLAHSLDRELFDAGEVYAGLKRRYLAAWDTPLPDRLGGSGGDIDSETLRRWRELIDAWEQAMMDGGGYHGRLSVIAMAFDRSTDVRIYPERAILSLKALATFQGRLSGKS